MKTEAKIQQEIVLWFRKEYPSCCIFSVPNERSNTKEQMRMISTGLLAGVSDLIVVIPTKVLFVEVKDHKGQQSERQKIFENTVTDLALSYYVVRSLEDFQNIPEIKNLKNN